MKHVITSAAAALATAALVVTGAGSAHAATDSVNDRTGDVWRTPLSESGSMSEAGWTLNGDLDNTVVDHGTDTVTITQTYARLATKKVALQPYFIVRTDTGGEYVASAFAGPRQWEGDHAFWDSSVSTLRHLRGVPPTEEEPCAAMTHRFNYRADTVTVEIPRSCVGDASWVKVKSLVVSLKPRSERMWIDNGHIRGHAFRGWSAQVDAEVPQVD